jgi:hypothetical protein
METHTEHKESFINRAKGWLGGLAILLIIVYSFYTVFVKTSNEVGFLGMDKVGRQVFIQTVDAYLDPNINVDLDFNDHNILERIVIQEPMRTVLKFDIRDTRELEATPETVNNFLNQPASVILNEYHGKITMQDDYEVTPNELKKTAIEKDVQTVADLLSGFGFKRYEVYARGKLIKSVDLPKTKNVLHAG